MKTVSSIGIVCRVEQSLILGPGHAEVGVDNIIDGGLSRPYQQFLITPETPHDLPAIGDRVQITVSPIKEESRVEYSNNDRLMHIRTILDTYDDDSLTSDEAIFYINQILQRQR